MRALRIAALFPMLATPLVAQRSGIVGTVADTLGVVLGGVQVELAGTDYGSITNIRGEFRLSRVKPGHYTLFMRRVGYEALSMKLNIEPGDPMELDFELTPTQVRLAAVSVKAAYVSDKLKRVGFESRLKTSGVSPSRFITRAEIEKKNPASLTHLLERMGGRARNCLDASVYMDGLPPTFTPDNGPPGLLRSGSSIRSAARAENNTTMKYRPLESIPVKVVEGMEIYTSTSEIPTEFRVSPNGEVNGKCVILIWTRER